VSVRDPCRRSPPWREGRCTSPAVRSLPRARGAGGPGEPRGRRRRLAIL